jgi:CrcB protein
VGNAPRERDRLPGHGVLSGVAEVRGAFSNETRLLLFTGVLGGFTTFSAFGYETFTLARTSGWGVAAGNVALQVVLGLGAVWAGHRLAVSLSAT